MSEKDGTIKQIDAASVHRICSGQVVVDLATATKELLENSLDAGATNIIIRFKNYGVDSIEVSDDGSGISASDYDHIGQKHHTSKVSTFESLDDLETFGFRGEALSSLCALSGVHIVTATSAEAPRATRLELDHHGGLISKKTVSAKRGTTVTVSNLFSTLPVRRKEFSKNCKREFAKVITLLQGYALICANIKLSVFHQPPSGTLQLSTSGNKTVRENIMNVFGAKMLTSLEPLHLNFGIDIRHIGGTHTTETIEVVGYVSKPSHGEGRSSADRQFFYINSRPCIQPKIARTFNEIYRSYNSHQYPFLLVDFRLSQGTFDLNLTPDKRTILLHEEQSVIKELNDGLTQFFDSFQHTLPVSQFLTSKTPRRTERIKAETPESSSLVAPPPPEPSSEFGSSQPPPRSSQIMDVSAVEKTVSNVTEGFKDRLATYALDSPSATQSLDSTLTPAPEVSIQQSSPTPRRRKLLVEPDEEEEESSEVETIRRPVKRTLTTVITPSQLEFLLGKTKNTSETAVKQREVQTTLREQFFRKADASEARGKSDNDTFNLLASEQVESIVKEMVEVPLDAEMAEEDGLEETMVTEEERQSEEHAEEIESDDVMEAEEPETIDEVELGGNPIEAMEEIEEPEEPSDAPPVRASAPATTTPRSERSLFKSRQRNAVHNLSTKSTITLDTIKSQHTSLRNRLPHIHNGSIHKKQYNTTSEKAEERLSLTVSKDDFSKMQIIGQFNLGFILTTRERDEGTEDLFIIDQHASDEKYNFERLQAETTFSVQTLARPQQLELTAMEEAIVLDHLDVFKVNGFEIRASMDDIPGKRCYLHAIPMSGNTVFTLSDLEELIHLVQLHPDKKSVRCSKARAMFAMRACRSSIMIGKALSEKMMERVVRNLGGLDKPWSCPHGRPTMRHLTELNGWTSWDGDCK